MYKKRIFIILLLTMVMIALATVDFHVYADTARTPVTLTKKADEKKEKEAVPNTADSMPLGPVYIIMTSAVSAGYIALRKFKNP